MNVLRSLKPGWYVLVALVIYAAFVTVALSRSNNALREVRRAQLVAAEAPAPLPVEVEAQTLWFPVVGAGIPATGAYLPGAERAYRRGVNQGFDFYDGDAGVPIPFGAPVVAAIDGTVVRVDLLYDELDRDGFARLLSAVEGGADEAQLDRLRGRQVWIATADGATLRYAHLSGVAPELEVGSEVQRGQVVGFVGNSGTEAAVHGATSGSRLHFEVWLPDGTFFGQGLSESEVRERAAELFGLQ